MTSSEVVQNLAPFLSWIFLPNLATRILLRLLYDNKILTRPSTPIQAELHAKRVRTLVIIGYLLYTIFAAVFQRSDNFYESLGVQIDDEVDAIKRSFRKLAIIYHPDKIGGGAKNERFFINLRRAHDCLVEPIKRTAYDRFGESILDWKDAITMRDYYIQGLQNSILFYIINPIVFGFMHWINSERIINYWQFSLLISLLSTELYLIVNPSMPNLFAILPSRTTQHDLISALHTTYIAITLASSHLSNLLPEVKGESAKWQNRSFDKDINEMKEDIEGFRLALQRMDGHWRGLTFESERALSYSLLPLRPEEQTTAQTRQEAAASIVAGHAKDRRKPNAAEETFIHLLGRLIFRARVSAIPGMRPVMEMQSAESDIIDAQSTDADGKSEEMTSTDDDKNGIDETARFKGTVP